MLKIFLVGAGAMGSALAKGWKQGHYRDIYDVYIIDPQSDSSKDHNTFSFPDEIPHIEPDIVIFALKPHIIQAVIPQYDRFQNPMTPFISIAAGTSLEALKNASTIALPSPSPWIRVMPNMGATVGFSITGLYTDASLTVDQMDQICDLFLSVGKAFWVESEDMIDRVTAISGSGPGYFFRFVESLTQSAVNMGFTREQAELMAQETLFGAAALLQQGETAEIWRQRVTSLGGTTAAALETFDRNNLDDIVKNATQAAYDRARELSSCSSP